MFEETPRCPCGNELRVELHAHTAGETPGVYWLAYCTCGKTSRSEIRPSVDSCATQEGVEKAYELLLESLQPMSVVRAKKVEFVININGAICQCIPDVDSITPPLTRITIPGQDHTFPLIVEAPDAK